MKRTFARIFCIVTFCVSAVGTQGQIISTIAGNGSNAYSGDNGLAIGSGLSNPQGVAIDKGGNVYVADKNNHRIRKIDVYGTITTVAGTGAAGYNGDRIPAVAARLYWPTGVAVDDGGNLYIADYQNKRIRMVDSTGIIHTLIGNGSTGLGQENVKADTSAMDAPLCIALDKYRNVYFSDGIYSRIRKINHDDGMVKTIIGNTVQQATGDGGPASAACVNRPGGMAFDKWGNLYFSETYSNYIRKIDTNNIVHKVAGDGEFGFKGDGGSALLAEMRYPYGICIDDTGNVYFSDVNNNRIRKIDTAGIIQTFAGTGSQGYSGDGGDAINARFNLPYYLALDQYGNMVVTEKDGFVRYIFIQKVNNINSKIDIFPNPATGLFHVLLKSDYEEPVTIFFTDERGQKAKELVTVTNRIITVQMLAGGVYVINGVSKHNKWNGKVSVTR